MLSSSKAYNRGLKGRTREKERAQGKYRGSGERESIGIDKRAFFFQSKARPAFPLPLRFLLSVSPSQIASLDDG